MNRPSNPPSWVPPEAPGWALAANRSGLGDELELPKTYHLPPAYVFYGANEDTRGVFARMHNWMRIRRWCIREAINPAAHGMVLLSASAWRVALEGAYYQVRHDVLDDENPACAQRRAEAISKLPLNPRHEHSDPPESKKRKRGASRALADQKRRISRAEVNVRFGLHAGFAPYDDTVVVRWGQHTVSFETLQRSQALWHQVVWELSELTFRLELLQLDRVYCSSLYAGMDGGFDRSQIVAAVWGDDGMVDLGWEDGDHVDHLSSSDPSTRRLALQRLARVMSLWPGGVEMDRLQSVWPTVNADVAVYSFYIRSAHAHFSRLPTIPFLKPLSVNTEFL